METLAQELIRGIDIICLNFHYNKDENIFLKSIELADRIQRFCGSFLQGNIYGMEDEEYQNFGQFVIHVLEDYLEALEQKDSIFLVDTLDHGLRDLVNIYISDERERKEVEEKEEESIEKVDNMEECEEIGNE